MKVGTKSLLFGVHQFLYHPVTVTFAWCSCHHRWPTWREMVCIVVHDWGYWGCAQMDNEQGENHPEVGARIAGFLFGPTYADLILAHSRHYAKRRGLAPSDLCWPDKFSLLFDPRWFYLLRARLSGELAEYRARAAGAGFVPLTQSDDFWFAWLREHFAIIARERTLELFMGNNGEHLEGL